MVKRPKPASPTWRAFLANHAACLASIDFFTVPTVRNRVLHVFVVLAHLRRRVLHFNVTTNPTAEWTSRQITEAFPWDTTPRYMIRDRDGIYGDVFRGRVKAMGITEVARPDFVPLVLPRRALPSVPRRRRPGASCRPATADGPRDRTARGRRTSSSLRAPRGVTIVSWSTSSGGPVSQRGRRGVRACRARQVSSQEPRAARRHAAPRRRDGRADRTGSPADRMLAATPREYSGRTGRLVRLATT